MKVHSGELTLEAATSQMPALRRVGGACPCSKSVRGSSSVPASSSRNASASSATRKATLRTPSCTSLRSSIRDSSSGPISVTVARTGVLKRGFKMPNQRRGRISSRPIANKIRATDAWEAIAEAAQPVM